MVRCRDAASRIERHLALVAAQRRLPARPALEPLAGHDDEPAPPAWLLDFAATGFRVADRNLSVVPADRTLGDGVRVADGPVATRRVRRCARRQRAHDARAGA